MDETQSHANEQAGRGRRYWRSLEELADSPGFMEKIRNEFPAGAMDWADAVSRRAFLKLMGASLALAGITGCTRRQPVEHIVPYVDPPEHLLPGRPRFYATAFPLRGFARGVIVEQHEGRPTKIEGNPKHPSSLGGTDAITQAGILQLYDPDRSSAITHAAAETSWTAFLDEWRRKVSKNGERTRIGILTGTVTSPTLAAQIRSLATVFPECRWYQNDPLSRSTIYQGTQLAFGRPLLPVYRFDDSTRILSVDSDFLTDEPGSVRYAREFAHSRRLRFKELSAARARRNEAEAPQSWTADTMCRLYAMAGSATITAAAADHRLPVASTRHATLLAGIRDVLDGRAPQVAQEFAALATEAAKDLKDASGRSLIVAGVSQDPSVHALAHLLNLQLGNVGNTVRFIEPVEAHPVIDNSDLSKLCRDLQDHRLDVLVIMESNPVYTGPADLDFATILRQFSQATDKDGNREHLTVHLGLYHDETARLCRWRLPASHYLESWGDVRGHDGTASIIQPLIAPLYASRTALELVAAIAAAGAVAIGKAGSSFPAAMEPDGLSLVHGYWMTQWRDQSDAERDTHWRESLRDGVVAGTASAPLEVRPAKGLDDIIALLPPDRTPTAKDLHIAFQADPCVADGEFANLGWLQELPRPLSKITWDNAAVISAATAVVLGLADAERPHLADGKLVTLELAGKSIRVPVLLQPGQPDYCVTLHLGYGRDNAGHVADGVGVNAYRLRQSGNAWHATGGRISASHGKHVFARTQDHQVMDGRDFARSRNVGDKTLDKDSPNLEAQATERGHAVHLSLYEEYKYRGYKWGMVIDQSACIGCNACVIACQAENNIPIVGRDGVQRGREMQWLRIDTYYGQSDLFSMDNAPANPEVHFQPMLCQHCENAPCEVVCPVGATTHSDEGINEMTYNRCVGTRYCSNNCPYKVRRFNFFQYNDHHSQTLMMMRNPEVTVRSRGVMEKCTYCVQRINRARIEAKKAWVRNDARHLPTAMRQLDGGASVAPDPLPALEVLTACQQACPTEAIVFGDLNDADALVSLLKRKDPWRRLNYGVLTELTTQPRTSYLERVRNPNPRLGGHA